MAIKIMGKFTAIGMRQKVSDAGALVINTCSHNDTDEMGNMVQWSWANPTNRRFMATHSNDPHCVAVSTEALWQGTKLRDPMGTPDKVTLGGDWRRGKGKKPIGAWDGPEEPILRTPGAARRAIYLPAFRQQCIKWMIASAEVRRMVDYAREGKEAVFLRDYDTGRGVDRDGPMSHAWVLASWLNAGSFFIEPV